MPDQDSEYRNVRSSEGSSFGRNTPGPVSSHGANSYRDSGNRGNQNQWSNQDRSSRDQGYEGRGNYNYGRDWEGVSSSGSPSSGDRDYRYGDPNPYMQNDRNGGYERSRGTGWRSESDDYRRNSNYDQNSDQDRYSRQDNSYRSGGQGRRISEYGRDEYNTYGQHEARGEQLDHGYVDRGEHSSRNRDYNYDPSRQSSSRRGGYDPSGYNADRPNLANQHDSYSSGSSRRQSQDKGLFDHTRNDYPASSRHGDRHRSGPDWSADSAASDFSPGDLRG